MTTETMLDYLRADIMGRMVHRLPGTIWDSNGDEDNNGEAPEMHLSTDADPDAPDEYDGSLYLRITDLAGEERYTYRVTVERIK